MAARSGRRGRARRLLGQIGTLALIYAVGFVLFHEKVGGVALAFIYAVILGLWVMFVMPTQCDYITQRGGHCTRTVHGKLNGCASHARMKRDALFGAVGKRNPGTGFRVLWGDGTSQIGWRITSAMPPPPDTGRSERSDGGGTPSARYNRWMMWFTAISAIAAVVALLLPK